MSIMLIEMFACLVAASLLGLIVGWMIKSTLAAQRLETVEHEWSSKLNKAELKAQQETGRLEDHVHQLDADLQTMRSENDSLSEALRENELIVHKARTDSIELNRQQAATQERLQLLLKTKDEELERLKDGSHASKLLRSAAQKSSVSTSAIAKVTQMRSDHEYNDPGSEEAAERIKTLTSKKDSLEKEQQQLLDALSENQETVALDKNDLPSELFDETVRLEGLDSASDAIDQTDYYDKTIVLGDETEPDSLSDTSAFDDTDQH